MIHAQNGQLVAELCNNGNVSTGLCGYTVLALSILKRLFQIRECHPYTGTLMSGTSGDSVKTCFYIVEMFWGRVRRLAYCALEDNALLLVLEG